MRAFSIPLCLVLLLAGCAAQARYAVPADDDAAITALYQRFSQAYDDLDVQAVTDLYDDDAFYLSPGDDVAARQGRAAIEDAFSFLGRVKERGAKMDIAFDILKRDIVGDLAYDVGYYRILNTPPDGGEKRSSAGKFVTVMKRGEDGQWRFVVDGYSGAPTEAFGEAEIE